MPLTDEERALARQKVEDLATIFANNCVFRYSQQVELKKTWKYRNSHGACFGMSLDWLRRKMHNIHNPLGKRKRNFNHPKYNNKSNRIHLTKKHGKLQDVYKRGVKDLPPGQCTTTHHLSAMAAANVVNSGLEGLYVDGANTIRVYSYELIENGGTGLHGTVNAHLKMRRSLEDAIINAESAIPNDPAAGILFHMQGTQGHATVLLVTGTTIRFFDPNVGEYQFHRIAERLKVLQFVSLLWFDLYHRFMQMDDLEFELIRYAAEDDGDND